MCTRPDARESAIRRTRDDVLSPKAGKLAHRIIVSRLKLQTFPALAPGRRTEGRKFEVISCKIASMKCLFFLRVIYYI